MRPSRGTLAPAHSATEAQFRKEYELQIRRMSCPSCGEAPVAVPAAVFDASQMTPAEYGR